MRLQVAHRQRLGQGERLHVVGAAAVEESQLDPSLEGRGLLPETRERADNIDVIDEQQRPLAAASRKAGEQVAATRGRADDIALDTGALEQMAKELGPFLFPELSRRVDPDVVAQEPDRLPPEPLLRRARGVGV